MVDIIPTTSIIIVNVNAINTPIKTETVKVDQKITPN